MSNFLDRPVLPEIVERNQNPSSEIGPKLSIGLRIQPLLSHGTYRDVIGADCALLAQEVIAAAGNLVPAEIR
jgi:hypothetical protein